jgi:hypothetical protein
LQAAISLSLCERRAELASKKLAAKNKALQAGIEPRKQIIIAKQVLSACHAKRCKLLQIALFAFHQQFRLPLESAKPEVRLRQPIL